MGAVCGGGGGWPNAACRNRSVVRRVSAHGGDLVSTSGAGAGEEGALIRMAQPGVSEVEKRGESVPGAQYKDGKVPSTRMCGSAGAGGGGGGEERVSYQLWRLVTYRELVRYVNVEG